MKQKCTLPDVKQISQYTDARPLLLKLFSQHTDEKPLLPKFTTKRRSIAMPLQQTQKKDAPKSVEDLGASLILMLN